MENRICFFKPFLTMVSAALLLCGGSLSLLAQTEGQAITTLNEVVVTASRAEESRREITSNVTVISEERIRKISCIFNSGRIRKISCIFRSGRLYNLLLIITIMSTMPKLPVTVFVRTCFHDIRSLTLIGNHLKCKRFLRWQEANRQGCR